MKIISLVPSITELLFTLGLEDQVIGRTKFCIHPDPMVKKIPQFGGTKKLHVNKIIAAKPDLIIANKEENLKTEIELLQQHFQVLVTDISTLNENNQMILDIGKLTQTEREAEKLVGEIELQFKKLSIFQQIPKTLYLIWNQPLMSVGNDTFIHHMLTRAGFKNVCHNLSRYPEIIPEKFHPEVVLLSSEPFPFKQKHIPEIQQKFPNAKIVFANGEMFSWYGSRMLLAPDYFLQLRNQIFH